MKIKGIKGVDARKLSVIYLFDLLFTDFKRYFTVQVRFCIKLKEIEFKQTKGKKTALETKFVFIHLILVNHVIAYTNLNFL